MGKSFNPTPDAQMNKGSYGYPLPPNKSTLVAPPRWTNAKLILATTSTEVVPQNVYQMLVMVWGGGAHGNLSAGSYLSGSGGGFAMGIVDVVPGQKLPTITVGAAGGGTSSFGTLISATGGSSYNFPGSGTVNSSLRGGFTASGGSGGYTGNAVVFSGGASGSPYGNGGSSTVIATGGGAWGGRSSSTAAGAYPIVIVANGAFNLTNIANREPLFFPYTPSAATMTPAGFGGYYTTTTTDIGKSATIGGGGGGCSTLSAGNYGGNGGILGGGGGYGYSGGGAGGQGGVILAWTEGY